MATFIARARQPVDGALLALFRLGFGAIVFVEVARYFYYDWTNELFGRPQLLFAFPWAPVARLAPGGVAVLFLLLGVAALGVGLGLCYRVAAPALALGLSYVFLLDASYSLDLNHLYLMCLFAALLAVLPAHRALSLDRTLHRAPPGQVELWQVWLVRFQMGVVFWFGGIAKLTTEWTASAPAQRLLAQQPDSPVAAALLRLPHADAVLVYGGIVTDLALPWLLCFRRTRPLGYVVAGCFLATNGLLFQIGVFPELALLATLMFADPASPRRLAARARSWRRRGALVPSAATAARTAPATLTVGLAGAALYALLQLLLPLRPFVYPAPSGWGEEGHFFSWRMMLLDKHGSVEFSLRDPRTGRTAPWDPARELTPAQIESLATRPMLAMQYAHHIADEVEAHEGVRPAVLVRQEASMGRHPRQAMVDPTRDLAAEPFRLLAPYDWIVPLAPLAPLAP